MEERRGITVIGLGTATAPPDRAGFTVGVETQGQTADEALSTNNAAAQRVIDAVKAVGVAAGDVQTQQVSVHSRYAESGQAIVGFTATNSVIATIREVAEASAVVEAAVRAGANQVFGPTFSISDRAGLYKGALDSAFADAESKAQALAQVTGTSLGRVLSVVEGGWSGVPLDAAGASPPIEPGRQEVQATLTVTFVIS